MKWSPILYGCFGSHGGEYAFDATAPGDEAVCASLSETRAPSNSWLVGESGGKVFCARTAFVGDYLGWDHQAARDRGGKGRKLEFTLCYTAPAGTALPQASDLERLEEQVRADLKRFGEESWRLRDSVRDAAAVELPEFVRPVNPTSQWDKVVTELESGKHKGKVASFTKDAEAAHWHSPQAEEPAAAAGKAKKKGFWSSRGAEEATGAEKQASGTGKGKGRAFLIVSAIGLGVLATGWLVRELVKKPKEPETAQRQ